ncbi:MAG: hypothetical protein ACYC53_13240 [Bacillota bacterium]
MALAIRAKAPIYVSESVLDVAGLRPKEAEGGEGEPGGAGPDQQVH